MKESDKGPSVAMNAVEPVKLADEPQVAPTATRSIAKKKRRKSKPLTIVKKVHGNYDTYGGSGSCSLRENPVTTHGRSLSFSGTLTVNPAAETACLHGPVTLVTAELVRFSQGLSGLKESHSWMLGATRDIPRWQPGNC